MILSCYSSRKDTNFIDIMFSLRTAGGNDVPKSCEKAHYKDFHELDCTK